ncbi:MAG: exopolysaccharide biosynthesis protein [Phycisphaerae bacterium]
MSPDPDRHPPPASPPGQRKLRLSAVLSALQQEVADGSRHCAEGEFVQIGGETRVSTAAESATAIATATEVAASAETTVTTSTVTTLPYKRRRAPSDVTVGEIVDRTREAGFGFLIAFLAVCSFPLPGLSVPFGVAIVFIAFQIVFGLHRPWLPASLRGHRVSLKTLDWIGNTLARWTSWMEYLVKPRFAFMTRGMLWSLCGLGILILGLGLSLPLPIPFSNLFFAIPIVLYAIAILEADGLLIMLTHTLTLWQCVFIYRIWNQIVSLLHDILEYLQSFLA